MRRIWSIIAVIFIALLTARQFVFAATALTRDSVVGDTEQWMEVVTNVASPLEVEIRKSHRPNDMYCRETEGGANVDIGLSRQRRLLFAFARQQEPGIALYEWHVCFVVDGTTYRAWHGYDPGPGAMLHAHCFIDAEQISAKDLTKNICPTADVALNPANYQEYGVATPTAWIPEPCTDVRTVDGGGPRYECFRTHGASDYETGLTLIQDDAIRVRRI